MNTDCAAALSPITNAAADDIGLSVMGFCPMDLVGVQFSPQQASPAARTDHASARP
jgi:hypothetical protein